MEEEGEAPVPVSVPEDVVAREQMHEPPICPDQHAAFLSFVTAHDGGVPFGCPVVRVPGVQIPLRPTAQHPSEGLYRRR